MKGKTDLDDEDIDRLLARLAATEDAAAPRPSEALIARVLADAGARTAPVRLPPRDAARGGLDRRGMPRRSGSLAGARGVASGLLARSAAGTAGAAVAMAAALALGFAAGYSGNASAPVLQVAADDLPETYVVSDAGSALFGGETAY